MPRRFCTLASAAVASLAVAPSAQAQFESFGSVDSLGPYYVGASQGLSYQSNVFNQGSGRESDYISSTTLRAGLDQPISRQRVFGTASVSRNSYAHNGRLDNTSYFVGTGADWQTIGNLSGTLRANWNRNLADYNAGDAPENLDDKNIETTRDYAATARLGVVTRLTFEGGLTYRTQSYSVDAFRYREYKERGASARLKYALSGALTVGSGVSGSWTRYPDFFEPGVAEGESDKSTRRNVDFYADWTPDLRSVVNGRVSFGKTKYSRADARDFSGVTGSISWNWKPTGKITVRTALVRDDGQDVGVSRLVVDEGGNATDNSKVTNSLFLSATYLATAKVNVTASGSYAHRKLLNTRDISQGGDSESAQTNRDNLIALGLAANWEATRIVGLSCRTGYDARHGGGDLAQSYHSYSVGCFVSATLR